MKKTINNLKNKRVGFTLVELLVVIAILAVLASVSVIGYLSFVKKARVSNDVSLTTQMNTVLASNEVVDGKNTTPYDAISELDEDGGFDVNKISPTANGYFFGYDKTDNRMVLFDEGMNVVAPEGKNVDNHKRDVFLLVGSEEEMNESKYNAYSFYLKDGFVSDGTIDVSTGVDVGTNLITTIQYSNSTSTSENILIRTNSYESDVVLSPYVDSEDNTKGDHISFYGTACQIVGPKDSSSSYTGIKVANNSLEVNGRVKGIKVDSGHIDMTNAVNIAVTDNDEGTIILSTSTNTIVSNPNNVKIHAHTTSEDNANSMNNDKKSTNVTWDYDGNTEQADLDDVYHHSDDEDWNFSDKTEEVKDEAKSERVNVEKEEETTAVVYNATTNTYYDDLYTAISAVPENKKETLSLLKDISGVSNKNYEINANQNIVLDLNGHTLSTVAPNETTSYTIVNYGTLTVKDNTDIYKNGTGKGKIISTALKADMQDVPGYASNTITNNGNFTIESGLIENKGSGYACFAIDNQTNGASYDPIFIMNGGKLLQESQCHYAFRMFCNSTTNYNKAIFNYGIIEGGYAFWLHTPNGNANCASLTINGGTFISYDGASLYFGGSGSTTDTRDYSNTDIIIYGGKLGSMMAGGVSSEEKVPKIFEINGGVFDSITVGSYLKSFLKGGTILNESETCSIDEYINVNGYYISYNTDADEDGNHWIYYSNSGWVYYDMATFLAPYGYVLKCDGSVITVTKDLTIICKDMLADGYKLQNNGDGTYTIVKL